MIPCIFKWLYADKVSTMGGGCLKAGVHLPVPSSISCLSFQTTHQIVKGLNEKTLHHASHHSCHIRNKCLINADNYYFSTTVL